MQLVAGGNEPKILNFISKEDAEMRAPGNEIAQAADASPEGFLGEVRRKRDRAFILVEHCGAFIRFPAGSRSMGVKPAAWPT